MASVIYWFHRDLRVADNLGLAAALATGKPVVPLFVLDPRLAPSNDIPATRVVLWRALNALDAELRANRSRLICRLGSPEEIVPAVAREAGAEAVYMTRMLGSFPRQRDDATAAALAELGVRFDVTDDDTLVPPDALRAATTGKHFSVYTPFNKQWQLYMKDHEPGKVVVPFDALALPADILALPGTVAEAFNGQGDVADKCLPAFVVSEQAAQDRLAWFTGSGDGGTPNDSPIAHYHTQRDLVGIDGTSRLSVHLAWGTLSIRAAYLAALRAARSCDTQGRDGCRVWVNELAWREFYHHLLTHAPHAEHGAYQQDYDQLVWEGDLADFDAWKEGRTGYPIVDAGMRQMNQCGWMHNRTRMITASFLTKDLLLDWRLGEKYFAQRLIDYDIGNNNGGWQWSASTGTDAQPYFRVFSPISQGLRYDVEGTYVKQWVPELAKVPASQIHTPWNLSPAERRALCPDYPPPIVDHSERRERAIQMYVKARAQ